MMGAVMSAVRRNGLAAQWSLWRRHAVGDETIARATQQALYEGWVARQALLDGNALESQLSSTATTRYEPLISVLMPTFNTPRHLLQKAIDSIRAQHYARWELCIADDASTNPEVESLLREASGSDSRIRVVFRDTNGHISASSNSALALATGDFVALLDHDDELHPMALFWVAKEIDEFPDAGVIYSDEDKLGEDGRRVEPYFKCDFNYELFLSQNLISHLGVYRRSLLLEIGGFRTGYEGSQDYDVALRCVERLSFGQIRHIPKVLYHWRVHRASTAASGSAKPYAFRAGQRSLTEHLQRVGLEGEVLQAPEAPDMYRVRMACPQPEPDVEIIIPTRDRADLMRMSVNSILKKTSYRNYRICIIDNGSMEPETLQLFDHWRTNPRIRIVRNDRPFNFSALNNAGVSTSECTFVCLLNNDVEVLEPDWLTEMTAHANRPDVGCVGARLWYPNKTLQHAGVVLGLHGVAGHAHKFLPRGHPGYFGRAVLQQAFCAVTAACLLIRRATYLEVGGLDEQLEVAFNDIDFCLRVVDAGYRNVWTPYAELYHHESLSRGYEDSPQKQARFLKEIEFMKRRWGTRLVRDPYYSPNLSLNTKAFSINEV